MSLVVTEIPRMFMFGEIELNDPDPNMSLDKVREHYALVYPEIMNASVNGPSIDKEKEVQVFNFSSRPADKG